MKSRWRWLWLLVWASSLGEAPAGEAARVVVDGVAYAVYRCRPDEVRLFWRGPDGRVIGQFSRLQQQLADRGERLAFAMNAGIFEEGGIPAGLHVEEGRPLRPLNRRAGRGNFYLQPNGVFCIVGSAAHILETVQYARAGLRPRLAVQSGPLLLHDDRIHPAFRENSPNRLHRNGVGLGADGGVVFAITEFVENNRVNLYHFAEFSARSAAATRSSSTAISPFPSSIRPRRSPPAIISERSSPSSNPLRNSPELQKRVPPKSPIQNCPPHPGVEPP